MATIPVNEIKDGMVLARPILGPSGNVLLAAGVELKAALASRFASWGIPNVEVEDEAQESESQSGELDASFEERVKLVFQGKLHNPKMKLLFDCIKEHKMKV